MCTARRRSSRRRPAGARRRRRGRQGGSRRRRLRCTPMRSARTTGSTASRRTRRRGCATELAAPVPRSAVRASERAPSAPPRSRMTCAGSAGSRPARAREAAASYWGRFANAANDGFFLPPMVISPDCQPPRFGSSLSRNQSIMSTRGFLRRDRERLLQVERLLRAGDAEELVGWVRLVAVLGDPDALVAVELRQHLDQVVRGCRASPPSPGRREPDRLRRRRVGRAGVVRVVRPRVERLQPGLLDRPQERDRRRPRAACCSGCCCRAEP